MSSLVSIIVWNTVLAGGLGVLVYWLQRSDWLKSRPGLSHWLWIVVLLKLVVPPLYGVEILAVASKESAVQGPANDATTLPPGLTTVMVTDAERTGFRHALPMLLTMVAILGSAAMFVACFVRSQRIGRIVRLAQRGTSDLQEMVTTLAGQMGIDSSVVVLTIDACVSPFLWVSRGGPAIVLPSALVEDLDRRSLRLVIHHELTHFVRRDHWTNLFSTLVVVLLWWNPVAWWARRELRFVQELCCDASVLAAGHGQRRRYAETLLQTIDFVASDDVPVPSPATAFSSCSTFQRRVEMIGSKDLSSRVPHLARLFIVPLGAMLIATTPAAAHDEDSSQRLDKMRGEIRELRAAVNDLQSVITRLTRQQARDEDRRVEDRDDDRSDRLTRKKMLAMAEDAQLNDKEFVVLLQLGNSVDGNPRQFQRLIYNDDLNDVQMRVLRKFVRDANSDNDERRDREILRLTRRQLRAMADRARLNEDERSVMDQLAEMVDMNARQFEGLTRRDDLNDTQMAVLRKLMRDRGDDEEHRERPRLTRKQLRGMAERARLNEDERSVLDQLAERVDMNARQFERLIYSDDLNETQKRVLKKLARDHDDL